MNDPIYGLYSDYCSYATVFPEPLLIVIGPNNNENVISSLFRQLVVASSEIS